MAVHIEHATIEDLVSVAADYRPFWGERARPLPYHPMLIHEFGETAFVVRGEDGEVIAHLFGLLAPHAVGYIHLVAVREGHRREGLARMLYERFETAARARGALSLKAITRPANEASLAFHSSCGFTAREVPDYTGPGETRVLFEKRLAERAVPVAPHLRLGSGAELRPVTLADADALHAAIEDNRAHLAPYLPWADEPAEGTLAFVERSVREMQAGETLRLIVLRDGRPAGMASFVDVSSANRKTGIGYWLVESEQGQGTMTQAVEVLVEEAFARWDLERVEIRVAAENTRSRAIPERLGFTVEGTLRRAYRAGGRVHDEVVYALLSGDRQGGMSN